MEKLKRLGDVTIEAGIAWILGYFKTPRKDKP